MDAIHSRHNHLAKEINLHGPSNGPKWHNRLSTLSTNSDPSPAIYAHHRSMQRKLHLVDLEAKHSIDSLNVSDSSAPNVCSASTEAPNPFRAIMLRHTPLAQSQ
jgi:hypothetical protein